MTGQRHLAAGAPVPGGSVFLRALGREASRLHPEVYRYVSGSGVVGQAVDLEGVFDVAGSRLRRLNLLARPIVGPGLLVTAFERDVPFRVANRPGLESVRGRAVGAGARAGRQELGLHAERTFEFRSGGQSFVDVLLVGDAPGTLRNLLGECRRVELELRCTVTDRGRLRLESGRAWLRFGRLRVRLPRLLSVQAVVEDGFDEATGRNTVDARVGSPILGTVLEYRGSFRQAPRP
ncbi:DUF4166 domain-containing protein [Leucobacter aridicollis]|uniref:DUF4166 domain-containing protein n=1 Tax=Leucobacter aridicollis TaxID=283878 RepID=A0A852R1C1_9MICO|nr:DUF4166 domain-containing protein [Leucobacter aridicollis]MBL3681574.1 DUF4166 domain-containing protein [Leucobacter aridicollis]NYD27391.1 hypothetical protein [Leucobacter aridicollis]